MLKRDSFPFDFIFDSGDNAKVFRKKSGSPYSSFFSSPFHAYAQESKLFFVSFSYIHILDYILTNTNRVFESDNNFIIFRIASRKCLTVCVS